MKRSDIFTLILVAGIGTLAAFLICNKIMGDPNMAKVEFKALSAIIKKDLVAPDAEVYNSTAVNPTVEVYVGDCIDIDQNGLLDKAELIACGKEEASQEDEETEEEEGDEEEVNSELIVEESDGEE